jgi:hypothetical protein
MRHSFNNIIDYQINDGFIFTPTNQPYINRNTLKYKFPETMTIDFLIKQNQPPTQYSVHVYDNTNSIVPFVYNNKTYPLVTDSSYVPCEFLRNDLIVECQFDSKKLCFIPYKIRHDKSIPNHVSVAKDVFYDILHPVTFDNLLQLFTPSKKRKSSQLNIPRIHNNKVSFTNMQIEIKECESLLHCILTACTKTFTTKSNEEQQKCIDTAIHYLGDDHQNVLFVAEIFQINIIVMKTIDNLNFIIHTQTSFPFQEHIFVVNNDQRFGLVLF